MTLIPNSFLMLKLNQSTRTVLRYIWRKDTTYGRPGNSTYGVREQNQKSRNA